MDVQYPAIKSLDDLLAVEGRICIQLYSIYI